MAEEKRKRTRADEADETLRKAPRMDALAAADPGRSDEAPLVLSDSTSTSPSPSTSTSTSTSTDSTDSEYCEHVFITNEDLDTIVAKIARKRPKCHYYSCKGAASGGKEKGLGFMVCSDCNSYFCSGAVVASYKPQGHARWHADRYQHWVALWYHDPYKAYCFMCEQTLDLSKDSGSSEGETASDKGQDEWGMVVSNDAGGRVSGEATRDGCVIRGIPNLGNTCYMNALVQCLLALGKLKTMILRPDAPLGALGGSLKDFFVQTSSANDAGRTLNPQELLEHIRVLDQRFIGNSTHDSHELLFALRNGLDMEAEAINRLRRVHGTAVAPTISDSVFGGQLSGTISCKFCLNNSVQHAPFYDLQVPLPSKSPPTRSVASPPRNKSPRSQSTICRKLFQPIDGSITEKIQTIPEGGDSQIPGSELGDVVMEKTPKPLHVDSTEAKQIWQSKNVLHGHFQTPKNDVPGVIEVQIKAVDFLPNLFDDYEGMGESTADSHNPEDICPPPLFSIEAKENTYSVEVTTEDKGKAQSRDIVHDEAEHMNSLVSIEDCLALHFKEQVVEWRCDNCSNGAKLPSTNRSKDVEKTAASTNANTTVDGDQTEQSDRKTCTNEQSSDLNSLAAECTSSIRQPHDPDAQHQVILSVDRITKGNTGMSVGEKDSASCSTANKKPECHEGVQEAVPSCLPTEKQTNLLGGPDSQDASTQNQGNGKQVKLDDHCAHQVEQTQNKQEDRTGGSIQTHFISKLPPVLTIHLMRYTNELSKVRGHVSFKEILDVGPFMDPSSEDKDGSSYRLVGVVEHRGLSLRGGHYVAYVRAGQKQQIGGSSSWFLANDKYIKEVPLEEVLGCEAYLLFYERMKD